MILMLRWRGNLRALMGLDLLLPRLLLALTCVGDRLLALVCGPGRGFNSSERCACGLLRRSDRCKVWIEPGINSACTAGGSRGRQNGCVHCTEDLRFLLLLPSMADATQLWGRGERDILSGVIPLPRRRRSARKSAKDDQRQTNAKGKCEMRAQTRDIS